MHNVHVSALPPFLTRFFFYIYRVLKKEFFFSLDCIPGDARSCVLVFNTARNICNDAKTIQANGFFLTTYDDDSPMLTRRKERRKNDTDFETASMCDNIVYLYVNSFLNQSFRCSSHLSRYLNLSYCSSFYASMLL